MSVTACRARTTLEGSTSFAYIDNDRSSTIERIGLLIDRLRQALPCRPRQRDAGDRQYEAGEKRQQRAALLQRARSISASRSGASMIDSQLDRLRCASREQRHRHGRDQREQPPWPHEWNAAGSCVAYAPLRVPRPSTINHSTQLRRVVVEQRAHRPKIPRFLRRGFDRIEQLIDLREFRGVARGRSGRWYRRCARAPSCPSADGLTTRPPISPQNRAPEFFAPTPTV
jgi:hypothetical protein